MCRQRARIPFQEPWLTRREQIRLLQERGLRIDDPSAADRFLAHLNYYRFSGYCLAFEESRHAFREGTSFEDIARAYEFDLVLRDLLTEALEFVEVDFRATIAYRFGQIYGAFGHTQPAAFFDRFSHGDWLERVQDESKRSREEFVQHFDRTYQEFPDLPVWIATEIMSFGLLSRMFRGMRRSDQRTICSRYGLQSSVLESWMHHCVYVRNLCAHHSRVWDRVWAIKPKLPCGRNWKPPLLPWNGRLFATLLLLRQLLARMPAIERFAAEWKERIEQHLSRPPSGIEAPLARMGLTDRWQQHPVWATSR